MPKDLLSDAKIRTAKPYKLNDGDGLFLLIQPSGNKLFALEVSAQRKGDLPAIFQYAVVRGLQPNTSPSTWVSPRTPFTAGERVKSCPRIALGGCGSFSCPRWTSARAGGADEEAGEHGSQPT